MQKVTHFIQDNSINHKRRIKGSGVRPKYISSTRLQPSSIAWTLQDKVFGGSGSPSRARLYHIIVTEGVQSNVASGRNIDLLLVPKISIAAIPDHAYAL
jgi:hypothetical protein